MNFGTMQTALMRYGFDTNDPISIWLNAAKDDFTTAADWFCLEKGPYNVVMTAGTNFVTLPADFDKMLVIRDADNKRKLRYYDRHKFTRDLPGQSVDVGGLEVYTLTNTNVMQLWRTAQVNTNVEIYYQATVPDMVNPGDIPGPVASPFPTPCHYPIVVRAAAIALMAENEEQRAQTAQAEYQAALIRCIGKYAGERELDEPTTVDDVQGYAEGISSMSGY